MRMADGVKPDPVAFFPLGRGAAGQGAKRTRRNATRAPVLDCCSATRVKKSTV